MHGKDLEGATSLNPQIMLGSFSSIPTHGKDSWASTPATNRDDTPDTTRDEPSNKPNPSRHARFPYPQNQPGPLRKAADGTCHSETTVYTLKCPSESDAEG
ncbi:hypothetical protein QC763_0024610 [Podospora pseudopauciseta]|uniref:Uncharacterized protein n=1 Tax=Podospora pseudopauciseta TaxID=2093780 RepID=A0ABR0I3I0_9PEZI|nr:hypothetical protein QC763_0024610 [Podospora pseudopauciseta]